MFGSNITEHRSEIVDRGCLERPVCVGWNRGSEALFPIRHGVLSLNLLETA